MGIKTTASFKQGAKEQAKKILESAEISWTSVYCDSVTLTSESDAKDAQELFDKSEIRADS